VTPASSVSATPHYDRLARRLSRAHPEFPATVQRAIAILSGDPTNRTGRHHIRKLAGVGLGDGQWRLRLGRFRFRYDIEHDTVILKRCSLRREDTYRR